MTRTIRLRSCFAFLLLAPCCFRLAAAAAEPGDVRAKADQLVRQLGSKSYPQRTEAAKELLRLELAAEAALIEGLKSNDLEVRQRCDQLLRRVRQAEFSRRVDKFLTAKNDGDNRDLPGWMRFQTLVGDDAQSRVFYVEMLRLDKVLLSAVDKDPAAASKAFSERTSQIYKRLYTPNGRAVPGADASQIFREEIALLLLLTADPKVKMDRSVSYNFFRFFYQSPIRDAMKAGKDDPFRRLFLAWMHEQNDDFVIEQIFRQSTYFEKSDLLEIALKVLKDEKRDSRGKAFAFTIVGRHGKKEHAKLLEPYLTSKTNVCGFGIGGGLSGRTNVGDVALAMILHLEGEQHADYNFTYTRSPTGKHLQFNASFLGFTNDADRESAFKKWESRKKQKEQPKEEKG